MNESFENNLSNTTSNMMSQPAIAEFPNSTETNYNQADILLQQFLLAASAQDLYRVGVFIGSYIYLVITPVGLIGNVLTLLVLLRDRGSGHSCQVYMRVLATVDSFTLLIGLAGKSNV